MFRVTLLRLESKRHIVVLHTNLYLLRDQDFLHRSSKFNLFLLLYEVHATCIPSKRLYFPMKSMKDLISTYIITITSEQVERRDPVGSRSSTSKLIIVLAVILQLTVKNL